MRYLKLLTITSLLSLITACGSNGSIDTNVPNLSLNESLIGEWLLQVTVSSTNYPNASNNETDDFKLIIYGEDNCELNIEDAFENGEESCQTGGNVVVRTLTFSESGSNDCMETGTMTLRVEFNNNQPAGTLRFESTDGQCFIEGSVTADTEASDIHITNTTNTINSV